MFNSETPEVGKEASLQLTYFFWSWYQAEEDNDASRKLHGCRQQKGELKQVPVIRNKTVERR